ncbi:MAG: OmpH family outer membrane protein [bacterium]
MKRTDGNEIRVRRLISAKGIRTCIVPTVSAAILCLALAFGTGTGALALEVGLVDVEALAAEHPIAKKLAEDLKKTETKRNEEFKKKVKEKFGVSETTELDKLPDEKKQQFTQFFQLEREKFQEEMLEKEIEARKIIEGDIIKIVRNIAKESKLDLVFDKRIVVFGGLDLTKDAIAEIKKLKAQ